MAATHQHFIPAAGQRWLLPFYDPVIALLTRERRWRGAILDSLDLKAGDVLVDVGCGTGTLAIMAKARAPGAQVIGLDPDPDALARATHKAAHEGVTIAFARGFGGDTAKVAGAGRASKTVSTFAFHHMSDEAQAQTLAAMREALAPGGAVHIADFTGGHFFHGPDSGKLIDDLTAAGFVNARKIGEFRTIFGRVTHVSGEKPRS
jgi:cyclopropane fatty-acyl-phospholipid synthase-like methyltransferase